MNGRTVGLATWEGLPDLVADDRLVLGPLLERGLRATPVVWSESAPDPAALDLVVIRSTWDYHHRRDAFLRWSENLGRRTRVLNDPATLRWNSDKRYLADLAARGLPVVPTVWGREVDSATATLAEHRWTRAVLKPCVSASGEGATILRAGEPERNEMALERLRSRGEVMLQPFLEATVDPGERSLVYLDGRFSHAVLRAPKFADRRTVTEGARVEASGVELDVAARTLGTVRPTPLYARVDLVAVDGSPHLMELELIEPLLYLAAQPGAAERFAAAIAARLA